MGKEVVQAQPDWFACNWRRVSRGDEYDRWPSRRAAFERHFQELEEFVIDTDASPAARRLNYPAATADKSRAQLTVRKNYADAPIGVPAGSKVMPAP